MCVCPRLDGEMSAGPGLDRDHRLWGGYDRLGPVGDKDRFSGGLS